MHLERNSLKKKELEKIVCCTERPKMCTKDSNKDNDSVKGV